MRLAVCLAVASVLGACGGSDADGDGFASDVDCDDDNAAIHPDADEVCNGLDDNCDGGTDVDPIDGVMWVTDDDLDGYGLRHVGCTRPATPDANVSKFGDCVDTNAMVFPGSTTTEVPGDGVDTDCDGNDFCTDLNCDGRPDVAVPSHHDGDYAITQPARLLSGPGGWALDPKPTTMSGTLGTAATDLNNDGYQDIIHASYHDGASVNTSSFIYWGPNHDPATRSALATHGAHWACVGDLDGNGFTDVVFANNTDGATNATDSYIYWNRFGAFAELDRIALPTNGTTHCTIDDLDKDGHPDIVFSNYANAAGYATDSIIYWGSTDATYTKSTTLPTVGSYANTIADVDGDGRKDIVFWSHYTGTSYTTDSNFIYWNRPGGFAPSDRTAFTSMGGFRGAVADLNNDGLQDIIAPGYHAGAWTAMASTYIYWGTADHSYAAANRTALALNGVLDTVVDDVNADGYADIFLTAQYDGDSLAPSAIFWGTAGGTYNDVRRTELPGYHVTFGGGIADFNHDGFKDVFLPGYHNNTGPDTMNAWNNQAFSRIYWGAATGFSATFFDQWATRGAWSAVIVGR